MIEFIKKQYKKLKELPKEVNDKLLKKLDDNAELRTLKNLRGMDKAAYKDYLLNKGKYKSGKSYEKLKTNKDIEDIWVEGGKYDKFFETNQDYVEKGRRSRYENRYKKIIDKEVQRSLTKDDIDMLNSVKKKKDIEKLPLYLQNYYEDHKPQKGLDIIHTKASKHFEIPKPSGYIRDMEDYVKDKAKKTYDKAKEHVARNKGKYIAGASTAGAGAVGLTAYALSKNKKYKSNREKKQDDENV
ncbi:MAG: hypothetical protein HUJ56_07560 [Erysipelotrichaceae bacterium]|nr:hypothetical protein [Erysipelotrichaceae bacterium]